MAFRRWQELSSAQVGALDARRAVAVLPLAATEQHGPHLPIGTDCFIADGLIAEASSRAPDELSAVILPTQAIGASLEHQRFPGTLSLSAAEMMWAILAQADGVARAGLRKLVLLSAHGGNISAMTSAALECRARHRMLAVITTFARLGLPDGLIDEREKHLGAHAGLVETALMLHFRPELVNMANAADFTSLQETLEGRFKRLRAYGSIGFGWLASDLNRSGATGNAAGATAEIGAAIAAFQAGALLELLREVAEAEVDTILSDETRL